MSCRQDPPEGWTILRGELDTSVQECYKSLFALHTMTGWSFEAEGRFSCSEIPELACLGRWEQSMLAQSVVLPSGS